MEQELPTLPEHLSSPDFSGIRAAQTLVFCVVFCISLFVLLLFCFGHCVVLSVFLRLTASDCPFVIFKLFICLFMVCKLVLIKNITNKPLP